MGRALGLVLVLVLVLGPGLGYGWSGLFAKMGKKLQDSLKLSKKVMATMPLIFSSNVPMKGMPSRELSTAISSSMTADSILKRVPSRIDKEIASNNLMKNTQFVRHAVQNVGQSVVRIDCEREVSQVMTLFSSDFSEGDVIKVSGTGIVASTDGFILTNAHVVENAKKVVLTFSNGRSLKASVVAIDELTDLAVLKADMGKDSDYEVRTYSIPLLAFSQNVIYTISHLYIANKSSNG
jgi:S1-C subfamily serine protease